jgi:hypothetical protein
MYQTRELSYQQLLHHADSEYRPGTWASFYQTEARPAPAPASSSSLAAARARGAEVEVEVEVEVKAEKGAEAEVDNRLQVVVVGLYGRRRMNRLQELGCTLSHLLAMRRAIYADLQVRVRV